ncbi:Rho GTPase-activating protein [Savitreella phatthalungensis]
MSSARIEAILQSDSSTRILSERAKQGISALRELSSFLRKRASLEDQYAKDAQRLRRQAIESFAKAEVKQGSFGKCMRSVLMIEDRAMENTAGFAGYLHECAEECQEVARELEKSRKTIKEASTRDDRQVLDDESARDKAIAKYESVAEEWARLSRGDPASRKTSFAFKSNAKPPSSKQIDDVRARLDAAQADRSARTAHAERARDGLQRTLRPRHTAAWQDLISQIDSYISAQLARYGLQLEEQHLKAAQVICPTDSEHGPGVRDHIKMIDDSIDLTQFILSQGSSLAIPLEPVSQRNGPAQLAPATRTASSPDRRSPFCMPLSDLIELEGNPRGIPYLVEFLIGHIDAHYLGIQGLYRISAPLPAIQSIHDDLPIGPLIPQDLPSELLRDPHVGASLLKQYFRELPDLLIPAEHCGNFAQTSHIADERQRRIALHQAINNLPDANYSTLRSLIQHLAKVIKLSEQNLMTADNLAIIWGPTLLGDRNLNDAEAFSVVIETAIQNCGLIFEDEE